MLVESEFVRVLQAIERSGNTLSSIVRQAWDGDDLRTLTKNTPANSAGAHVTILGHITGDELQRSLYQVEVSNGFANRFMFLAVRRSQYLSDPPLLDAGIIHDQVDLLRKRIEMAKGYGLMQRTESARAVWDEMYRELADGTDGLVGSLTARAAPHVLRLSAIYAICDGCSDVHPRHLERAYDLWKYSERSAHFIFGESFGDPTADTILRALENGPMTRTNISGLFGRHHYQRTDSALRSLALKGKVRNYPEATDGRSAEWWELCATSAESAIR